MKKTGRQAASQMKRWSEAGKTGVKGLCLKTCREAWGIGAKYPSAIIAWRNTPAKFKHKDPKLCPIGGVHYYEGGKYGHIVIQSDMKNKVWGTDLPVSDKIGLHHRNLPTRKWGYKYLGWSNWLNGETLPLRDLPK
jgi:hypothetical protein